jgi:hypothetical protein
MSSEPNLHNFMYELRQLYDAETDPRIKKIYGLIIELAHMTQRELMQTANTIEDIAANIQA